MALRPISYPLRFSRSDLVALPVDDLARQMRVSRAFLRLCFQEGCPAAHGEASAAEVLVWMFDHYEKFRAAAGLQPLAEIGPLPSRVAAKLRMTNALLTLLEFARTRATNWRQKRHLRRALERVSILGDRRA